MFDKYKKKINKITPPRDLPPYGSFVKWSRHVTRMSLFVYHTRGLRALIKRIYFYLKENIDMLYLIIVKTGCNVLFVSGCPGGSRYYRCKNQSEMLSHHGITSKIYGQQLINMLYLVDKFDVFVFQRVIYNPYIGQMIRLIKNRNKKIVYETDDLVFDPKYLPYMHYYNFMGKEERSWYENGIGREILEDKDIKHCVVATDYLAEAIKRKYPDKEVFVSYNKLGKEQISLAQETFAKRNEIKIKDGKIRIGYFSGSKSHNKDFEEISDVLLKILKENGDVILMAVGHIDLNSQFSQVENQIEHIPFVAVHKLPELILRSDINIAPLEIGNPFCQAKSALKFFEAGILGVPTVASVTGDFMRCIRNGENGFLAETEEQWHEYLTRLIKDENLRKRIGEAARKDSLEKHTMSGAAKDEQFVSFIRDLLSSHKTEKI